jgi:hypothetical protein
VRCERNARRGGVLAEKFGLEGNEKKRGTEVSIGGLHIKIWKKSESVLPGRLIMCFVCEWPGQQCQAAGGHSQQPADAVH